MNTETDGEGGAQFEETCFQLPATPPSTPEMSCQTSKRFNNSPFDEFIVKRRANEDYRSVAADVGDLAERAVLDEERHENMVLDQIVQLEERVEGQVDSGVSSTDELSLGSCTPTRGRCSYDKPVTTLRRSERIQRLKSTCNDGTRPIHRENPDVTASSFNGQADIKPTPVSSSQSQTTSPISTVTSKRLTLIKRQSPVSNFKPPPEIKCSIFRPMASLNWMPASHSPGVEMAIITSIKTTDKKIAKGLLRFKPSATKVKSLSISSIFFTMITGSIKVSTKSGARTNFYKLEPGDSLEIALDVYYSAHNPMTCEALVSFELSKWALFSND